MTTGEISKSIDTALMMGPSSISQKLVSARDCYESLAAKYFKNWRSSFTDDTDDQMISNGKRMVNGKVYTFVATGKDGPSRIVSMSISSHVVPADKFFEVFIELFLLTPQERARILKGTIVTFENTIKQNQELKKKKAQNQLDIPIANTDYRERLFSLANVKPKLRTMDSSRILRNTMRCIDYEDWPLLIHCNAS